MAYVDVNDVSYRRICSQGSFLNDPFFINVEMAAIPSEHKRKYFLYIVFYQILMKLVKMIQNSKEIRIDNLEEIIFSKVKEFLPYETISSPTMILRYEALSRVIMFKVIDILEDLSGGAIISCANNVNSVIRSLGESSYVRWTLDLCYMTKDGDIKIILFEPFSQGSVFNAKTGLAFAHIDEIHNVKELSVFTFGSDVLSLSNQSQIVAFNETKLVIDSRKREMLLKISNGIKNTFLINTISYDHCHKCSMKSLCRSKVNV